MAHASAVAHSQMASHIYFISLKTTPPCPAGSRAWRSSFASVVCGPRTQRETFLLSAQGFVAPLAALIAVAGASSFPNLISFLRSPSFKSWLNLVVICVTFTQNTIVSSISSSSIGGLRSSVSMWQGAWQQLMRWRGRLSNPLMMSPSFTFDGKSSILFPVSSTFLICFLAWQTGWRASSQCIMLALLDHRQYGPIESITAIIIYPQKSLRK